MIMTEASKPPIRSFERMRKLQFLDGGKLLRTRQKILVPGTFPARWFYFLVPFAHVNFGIVPTEPERGCFRLSLLDITPPGFPNASRLVAAATEAQRQ